MLASKNLRARYISNRGIISRNNLPVVTPISGTISNLKSQPRYARNVLVVRTRLITDQIFVAARKIAVDLHTRRSIYLNNLIASGLKADTFPGQLGLSTEMIADFPHEMFGNRLLLLEYLFLSS